MKFRPFRNFKTVLIFICSTGVLLDTFSIYKFWHNLNDSDKIYRIFTDNGISIDELGLDAVISSFQSTLSLCLAGFLIFDYIAYYYLLKYRNWARKYVLSIGFFYLIGCFLDFSLLQLLYGLISIYYLWGIGSEFDQEKLKQ